MTEWITLFLFLECIKNAVREIPNFNMSTQRNDVVDIILSFQMFYPVTHPDMVIHKGDILVSLIFQIQK